MKRIPIWLIAIVIIIQLVTPVLSRDISDMTPEQRAREIEKIKAAIAQAEETKRVADSLANVASTSSTSSQDVNAIIAGYESYLNNNCTTQKSNRCADALYSVSHQYYKKIQSDFIQAQEDYNTNMDKWERGFLTQKPVSPSPDYSKALDGYQKALELYPTFRGADEAYYQSGDIYMRRGMTDEALESYLALVQNQSSSRRVGAARFKAADIYFSDRRDYSGALEQLVAIDPSQLNDASREMAHFRQAEIYYSRGDFDRSTQMFGEYIDKCDRMEFPKRDLRPEALTYLAVSFSDMENGAQAALDYFDNLGGRRYEDTVTYAVGMKNYDHGQYEEAILALSRAIEKFPQFEKAPQAQTNIIYAYVIRERHQEANDARETLVDTYGEGSQWALSHTSDPVAVAKAQLEVKKALGSIAIFYHAKAQASKIDEERLNFYAQALRRYNEYIANYPQDKWEVYEYHYNAAEAYATLGKYSEAADYYDFVASADLSTYPAFQQQVDTIGISAEEQEQQKQADKSSPVDISQMDAGFNAIFSLDTLRKMKLVESTLEGAAAYQLPETQRFLTYSKNYQQSFPESKDAPEVLLLVADVMFEGEDYLKTIAECDKVVLTYGITNTDVFTRATKLKADAYTQSNQFDLAVATYDTLLARTDNTTEEYGDYVNLSAASMFLKATALRTASNNAAAAGVFKAISEKYPQSSVVDKAWFEAGASLEADSNWAEAANVFAELPRRFAESELAMRSFGRAGEDYVKAGMYTEAGTIMETAAKNVSDTAFAIGSLAKSAEYFKEAGNLPKSADMFYLAYQMFPAAENTPLALYNAGLGYEEAKLFEKAIEVYQILGNKYPENSFASEGVYSIGFCYQEMDEQQKMADAFVYYADKFPTDRPKQINALLLATEAYQEMEQLEDAEAYVSLAIDVFERYQERDAISASVGAKGYYIYGELNRRKLENIKLTGNSPAAVQSRLDTKVEALGPVLESYAEAIKLGVEEWTFKSTYSIGMVYVNFAGDLRAQKLFGSREEQIAAKIGLVSGLEQYYVKAQEKLAWNISTAEQQGISNEYVRLSEVAFMEMGYRKGRLLEEVGEIFRDAPIPSGLTADEEMYYREALDEKYYMALDAALPKYEEAMQYGVEMHVGRNEWSDSTLERIEYIDPTSMMMTIDLDAEKEAYLVASGKALGTIEEQIAAQVKRELDLALADIAAVVNSDMSVDDKIARLQSLEMTAMRSITEEDILISKYKETLGLQ